MLNSQSFDSHIILFQRKISLLSRTNNKFQPTLTKCHLIFDGWNLTSSLSEIFNLYFELLENHDFIKAEQKAIDSNEQDEMKRLNN